MKTMSLFSRRLLTAMTATLAGGVTSAVSSAVRGYYTSADDFSMLYAKSRASGMTNARVKREATKKRNQQRHKAAVRGAK